MKARIKKTGEIVNLASYATIALEQHDSWGNPIEVKPEEIESAYSLMNFDKYKYVGSKFIWNELNILWIMKFENNAIYEIIVAF